MNKFFIHGPVIALAPMADYTDEPFSLICREFGADLIFREMVSSEALVRGNKKTLEMARINKNERPVILQIFGASPSVMAGAARILEKECKPDGIDINMGCPVRKIAGVGAGCELMRDPGLAAEIVRAVKSAVKVPVSVKMRLGWKNKEEIIKFAPIVELAGADFITVHGRTREQQYSGDADWEMIARVKSIVKIPVIANGSIWSADDAAQCLKITGADGVAIARGALGNPWIFKELKGGAVEKNYAEIKSVILRHMDLHLKHYGEPVRDASHGDAGGRGIVTFRKHLGFYFKGVPGAKDLRVRLVRVNSKKELEEILNKF